MATAFTLVNTFLEALAEKKHDLSSDQIVIALTNSAPSAANSVLADITEISYTNLSSRNITTVSSSQSGGTYSLVLQDHTLTASGAVGPFRYGVIYNADAANDELIGFFDYSTNLSMVDTNTFLVNFGATLFTLSISV
jgi:hypothetical protein